MKKIIRKTILLLAFVASPLFANTGYLEPGSHHNLRLESYYYAYRETVNGGFFMKDTGPMFGVDYNFAFQPENTSFRFGVEGRAAYGSINYHSNGTGNLRHHFYSVLEGRLLGSYALTFENQWILEGYSGLGIRYLASQKSSKLTTTGHSSSLRNRKSQYNYVPIGIRIIKGLQNEMQWVSYLEYDWFLSGLQKSYMEIDYKNRQHHGYGARIGVDFHIPSPTYCFSYTVGIFARYWNIKDSVIVSGAYEPKNTTQEIGVRIGMTF